MFRFQGDEFWRSLFLSCPALPQGCPGLTYPLVRLVAEPKTTQPNKYVSLAPRMGLDEVSLCPIGRIGAACDHTSSSALPLPVVCVCFSLVDSSSESSASRRCQPFRPQWPASSLSGSTPAATQSPASGLSPPCIGSGRPAPCTCTCARCWPTASRCRCPSSWPPA